MEVKLKEQDPPGGWEYIAARMREIESELRHRQQERERANALPPDRLANHLAYWERTLRMIGEESPQCRCEWCGPCLARGALSGPGPGERWHEWEAMKALNVELLRKRQTNQWAAA